MVAITKSLLLSFLSISLVAAQGTQFITGACTSDADCASGCCGFNSGKCAGPVVAQERDGGCGFGDATPNDTAAQALVGEAAPAANATAEPEVGVENNPADDGGAAAAPTASSPALQTGAADSNDTAAAPAPGTQFITGACTSDADCASRCCGFNSGKCAGPAVAQERDGGCGFGDAQPNDDAARALSIRAARAFKAI